jgi:hypothetical protein
MSKVHFVAGQKLAALSYGMDNGEVAFCDGLMSRLEDHRNQNYGIFQKILCKYAADAFSEVGQRGTLVHEIYKAASQVEDWYPELDKFVDPILHALGKTYAEAIEERNFNAREAVKDASLVGLTPAIAGNLINRVPSLVKNVAGFGMVSGGLAGALAWLLNRHMSTDTEKIDSINVKRRYYKKLTDEIRSELTDREVTPETLESAVHDVI